MEKDRLLLPEYNPDNHHLQNRRMHDKPNLFPCEFPRNNSDSFGIILTFERILGNNFFAVKDVREMV